MNDQPIQPDRLTLLEQRMTALEENDRRQTKFLKTVRIFQSIFILVMSIGIYMKWVGFTDKDRQETAERIAIGLMTTAGAGIVGLPLIDGIKKE